jgi:hypothetical protein
MGAAAHRHHPRAGSVPKLVEQQPGEREVTEVVGAELHLEAVGGLAIGQRHHPGIVHQHVDARMGRAHRVGEAADVGETGEVERHQRQLRPRWAARICSIAAAPFAWSRQASTTCAPRPASADAAAKPSRCWRR